MVWSILYGNNNQIQIKFEVEVDDIMIFVAVVLCKVTGSIQVVIKFGPWLKF